MSIPDDLRITFFQECEELLEALESGLLEISEGDGDDETVNSVFRAVHSIKGGAGAFGLDDLVRFAHRFETALDEVRAGKLALEGEVIQTALRASDVLSDLVRAARDETDMPMEPVEALLVELEGYLPEEDGAEEEDEDFVPITLDFGVDLDMGAAAAPLVVGPDRYVIEYRPRRGLYDRGNETVLLFRALAELGELRSECDTGTLPALGEIDARESYLGWTLHLTTDADEDDIREIFEFVVDDCDLSIEHAVPLADAPEESGATDEEAALDAAFLVAETDAETAPEPEPVAEMAPDALPEPIAIPAAANEPAPAAAPESTAAAKERKDAPQATVRVDLDRVERLINLVGELVINQSVLSQQIYDAGVATNSDVDTTLNVFKQLTRDIQEGVMAIRAQPVKSLFQRMSRIVREASSATGKTVRLITEGESTEVDKTVVERLSDPLTHMIRNSVDHGLEDPETRKANGKSAEGTVRLSATHRSGRVVIEVADDGAGINRERVKSIAEEKGLIPEGANLSDTEIDNLLFMPGFSTAKEISNLSGRGVGMDVVKRAIQSLGGRISITSERGKGSTFTISLPLTLAVLDGIVVDIGEETVVVPLTNVVETLKPLPQQLHTLGCGTRVLRVRGDFVPIVDVGYELGFRQRVDDFEDQVVLLTESENGVRNALLIDSIQDQRQVVIKGLQDNYGAVQGIAAATILGDGRIALILDVDVLVSSAAGPRIELDVRTASAG